MTETPSQLTWLDLAGARCAFTTLAEGNLALHVGDTPEEVLRRRRSLAASAGVDEILFMSQTHSSRVLTVGETDEPAVQDSRDLRECDAMVSTTGALAVLVADCVPVLFSARYGESGRPAAIAAAHAGRAGVLNGILEGTVETLRDEAPGASISALIGPAICGLCYEVPEEMADMAEMLVPGSRSTTRQGTASLDLPRAARAQLEGLDVAVSDVGVCTLESAEHSSYRRDPQSGRIAGVIVMPDTPQARGCSA